MRALTLVCVLGLGAMVSAQEWNQWRGPARDAAVPAASTPRVWPTSFQRVWRVEIGEGYSSPVISGGRVFVHGRRDPDEVISALDPATGTIVWQQRYTAPFDKNQYARSMAKGPHSTPLVSSDRLYTLGVTGVLTAWNVRDGSIAWRKDYSASVDTSKLFCGTAMSPLIDNGLLIVQVGSDVHGGRVMALDPGTGAERWTWRGEGPGYASPAIITASGVRQVVALTDSSIEGIDAKAGAALWSVPFPDEWHENIATPLWTGTHLIVSGTRQGTHAYALAQTDGTWRATEVWKNADVAMYMSSPVFADGILYGHSSRRKGQLVALNAADGTLRWATTGREGEHASVVLTPAHVVFLTSGGTLIVALRSARAFEEQRRYTVAESQTLAMPVLLADGILVRDATSLMRLAFGG